MTALTILADEFQSRTENAMTYPPPPGPGGQFPPDPVQPYQQPQGFAPDNPYGQSYGYDPNAPYGYGYGSPYGPPQYPMVSPPSDGMAIASLVVSCVSVLGLCTWGIGAILGLVGAILGHVAQRRIRNTGAGGRGMALAGVIVGWSVFVLGLIIAAVFVFAVVMAETSQPDY
jgi:hypothetical protein